MTDKRSAIMKLRIVLLLVVHVLTGFDTKSQAVRNRFDAVNYYLDSSWTETLAEAHITYKQH